MLVIHLYRIPYLFAEFYASSFTLVLKLESGFMVRKLCFQLVPRMLCPVFIPRARVAWQYEGLKVLDFEVRSASFHHSSLPGNVAGVHGLLDVWQAGVDEFLLIIYEVGGSLGILH